MADKDEKPLLQRRGGRRISIPSSPISPTLTKRGDRQMFNSVEPHATTRKSSEQPHLDPKPSSPELDGSVPPLDIGEEQSSQKLVSAHAATTEETYKSKTMERMGFNREVASSARPHEGRQAQSLRPTYLAEMASRSSPVIGRTSEGRDRTFETPVSAARNYSTTSLATERSHSDENILTKVPTAKKSRLNLLNPMSLLARRRSSQNAKLEEINVNVSPLQIPAIPENFDPSIRGSFVHDFSTPRSKRSHFDNSPRRETFSSPANARRTSEFGTPNLQHGSSPSPALHSPLFREHFQEDEHTLQPGRTAYLHNVVTSRKFLDSPSPAALPSFAQKLPANLPEPEKLVEQSKPLKVEIPQPDVPPPPPPKRTPSPNLDFPPTTSMPKHMTSVSSRFSFQIGEQGSSFQEKLLEEKHKEHFAKDQGATIDEHAVIDDYDDYDFDADDDLEERIPGVNTDYFEDDGFYNDDVPTRNIELSYNQEHSGLSGQTLQGFHFTPSLSTFSPASPFNVSEPTPRDTEGFAIGVANSKDSPTDHISGYKPSHLKNDATQPLFLEGLRISTVEDDHLPSYESTPPLDVTQRTFDDTDLYFDDGEFDMDLVEHDVGFDENLLDDESGHIRDIPAENARRYEEALERSAPGDKIVAIDPNTIGVSRDTSSSSNFVGVRDYGSSGFSGSRDQELDAGFSTQTSILTEDNLAAYHDALAEAAHFAAANGKFNRQVSFSSDVSDNAEPLQTNTAQQHFSLHGINTEDEGKSDYPDEYGTFSFADDDGLDDDLMIAEANAEALENDDDGFYGQEFGFYARAHGKEISDQVNGGFFAARGSNGIKRSHSGKANFQEPSLTPITERSEWSTRNSVASLQLPGSLTNPVQPVNSPGIAQLMDASSFEDDMTLSALMKLRRGAFGGSSTSINSLGERSMPGSSPLAHVSSYTFPAPDAGYMNKQHLGTSMRIVESEEEDDYDGEQLTLTQNTPRKKMPGASPTTPQAHMAHLAVADSPNMGRRGHHRRNSSGADSISYVRDADGHWVLEKRRTGEDGEQEIVEREYLAGARI